MTRHGGGAIVNIGSIWAKQAVEATPSSTYSMAKAGPHALTQHLAMERADEGIRVNAVSPAVVVTLIYGAFIDPDKIEDTLTGGFTGFHPTAVSDDPKTSRGASVSCCRTRAAGRPARRTTSTAA